MSEMTKFGADLIQAMSEALAHAQGKDVPGIKVHTVDVGARGGVLLLPPLQPARAAIPAMPARARQVWRRLRPA